MSYAPAPDLASSSIWEPEEDRLAAVRDHDCSAIVTLCVAPRRLRWKGKDRGIRDGRRENVVRRSPPEHFALEARDIGKGCGIAIVGPATTASFKFNNVGLGVSLMALLLEGS